MMVLTERLKGQSEKYMTEEQAGVRRDRSTTQHLLALKLIGEKARRKNIKIFNWFVDFSKAFDSIDQNITWAAIDSWSRQEVNTTAKGNKWKRHSSSENRKRTGRVVCNQQRHKTRRSDIAKYFHTGVRKNTRQDQGQGGRGEDKRNKD